MKLYIYHAGIFGVDQEPCKVMDIATTDEAYKTVSGMNNQSDAFLGKLYQGDMVLLIDPKGYDGKGRDVC